MVSLLDSWFSLSTVFPETGSQLHKKSPGAQYHKFSDKKFMADPPGPQPFCDMRFYGGSDIIVPHSRAST